MNTSTVSLATIGGGALGELFDAELGRILSNISDPNTSATQKRAMTITLNFKPGRERDVAEVSLKCESKLAGIQTVQTQLFLGKMGGKYVAVENDPRQSKLFDEDRAPLAAVPRGDFGDQGGVQ
jgi:hypothetical protein